MPAYELQSFEGAGYWQDARLTPDDIRSAMDGLLKRTDWMGSETSFYWNSGMDRPDHDASMLLDESSHSIEEFIFRADVREAKLEFLCSMIELGKLHQWVFMDRKGRLMHPNFEEIILSIQDSRAHRFCSDPETFIRDILKEEDTGE
ncbi:MAG: hypothetical protein AAFP92_19370 [Bacteroidota bacterium]